MTRNQIEYLKLGETRRANQALESLTAERDLATRMLGLQNLDELRRSNLSREAIQQAQNEISRGNLDELTRYHNLVTAETKRNNLMTSALRASEANETRRSNQAREIELNRANLAQEQLKRESQNEIKRSNLATEAIRRAANTISKYSVDVQADTAAKQIAEAIRNHQVLEQIQQQQADTAQRQAATSAFNARTERINTVGSILQRGLSMLETSRTNKANEAIRQQQAEASLQQAAAASERNLIEKSYVTQGWISSITQGARNLGSAYESIFGGK